MKRVRKQKQKKTGLGIIFKGIDTLVSLSLLHKESETLPLDRLVEPKLLIQSQWIKPEQILEWLGSCNYKKEDKMNESSYPSVSPKNIRWSFREN